MNTGTQNTQPVLSAEHSLGKWSQPSYSKCFNEAKQWALPVLRADIVSKRKQMQQISKMSK